jgi:hypothetical protein
MRPSLGIHHRIVPTSISFYSLLFSNKHHAFFSFARRHHILRRFIIANAIYIRSNKGQNKV